MPRRPDIDTLARETFGFDTLRTGQREAVEALLDRRDVLAVMPTGSGKSAIYQLAGIALEGPTVVVSPLIALQRDQVAALEESDAPPAAAVNSSLGTAARRKALEALARERLEFVLLAPEQLANGDMVERLRAARPSLLVIDEAHCISEWGHDFRPDYLRLGAFAEALGRPTVAALTATASPPVRTEIIDRLGLSDPLVVVRGFDRPNIHLGVCSFTDDARKREALTEAVVGAPKPGIVYVATRARAEETAEALRRRGVRAGAYHAGLRRGARDDVQSAFMDGDLDVVAATTAFGMGVDKGDVRFVFHLDVSESLDSYYQEVGRAGRDGADASALLFYRPEDLGLRRFFAGSVALDPDVVSEVAEVIGERDEPLQPDDLEQQTGFAPAKIAAAVGRLEEVGAVDVLPSGEVAGAETTDPDATSAAVEAQERRRAFDRSRVEMMRGYAESGDCRRAYILSYFGEPFEPPCGNCDACDAGRSSPPTETPFAAGTRVRHDSWGEGAVQRYEEDKMVVLFDEVGYRTLSTELVTENALLERI